MIMKEEIEIFEDKENLAKRLVEVLEIEIRNAASRNTKINIALSGGSTPGMFFKELAKNYSEKISWTKVKFFWGDERCVPPDDPESNYGTAKNILLDRIKIPSENIFRIKGENKPLEEVERYSKILEENLTKKNNLPFFDLIFLGMGEDGHTASIFPDQIELMNSQKNCAVSTHPETNQKRITLTGNVINNAGKVIFLITGKSKAKVLSEVINNKYKIYPAANVNPLNGKLIWMLDKEAAELL
jgi:6-phosphogluconolactonase